MIQEDSGEARKTLGLRHKYYLCGDATAPLCFLVHGRAGTYDVMWAFRRCLPDRCNIIAPQAPEPDELGGYSWWDVETQQVSRAAAQQGLDRLLRFMQQAPLHYALQPHKRCALGFSQGAGLLSIVIQEHPHLLDAAALLAGFVIESSQMLGNGPFPEVFMAHGSEDDIVPVARARQGRAALEALGVQVTFHEDPVGHKVGAPGMRLLREWISSKI